MTATTLHHLALMADLARRVKAISYLEIGVQEGRTLRAVLEANTAVCELILCDTWGTHEGGTGRGNHHHIEHLLHELKYQGMVTWLDGPSADLLPTLHPDTRVDLILVDADHTEEACYGDMVLAWPHLLNFGAMMVHDANHEPIQRAIRRFISEYLVMSVESYSDDAGSVVLFRE